MNLKKLSYSPDTFKIYLSERELRTVFFALDYFSAHTCPDLAFVSAAMVIKIRDSKLLKVKVG